MQHQLPRNHIPHPNAPSAAALGGSPKTRAEKPMGYWEEKSVRNQGVAYSIGETSYFSRCAYRALPDVGVHGMSQQVDNN